VGNNVVDTNTIIQSIDSLIEEGNSLRVGDQYGSAIDANHVTKCIGFVISALHLVELIIPTGNNAYLRGAKEIQESARGRGYEVIHSAGEMVEILTRLNGDVAKGLLSSVVKEVRGETFDDFLDHADEYAKSGSKNEAGVISGVVFEDTIRRLSKDQGIDPVGVKVDELISKLDKDNVITSVQAKRARACAAVRTSATHARWDEFRMADVEATITFTREILAHHFGL